jgi:lipopolysaccharide cholinephosphotransferase
MDREQLRGLQLMELYILSRVDDVCRKHNIRYYIVAGTLLGAIRHGGFIPWDDDIDIAMYREDYTKFLEIAPEELGPEFFVQTWKTERQYYRYVARVRANGTVFLPRSYVGVDIHNGVCVDIFPLDRIPKDYGLAIQMRALLIEFLQRLHRLKVIGGSKDVFRPRDTRLRRILRLLMRPLTLLLPYELIGRCVDYLCQLTSSQEGGLATSFFSGYGWRKEAVPHDVYGDGVTVTFEGKQFRAPSQWHVLLTRIYGDYLAMPPEEERDKHKVVLVDLGKYEDAFMKVVREEVVAGEG